MIIMDRLPIMFLEMPQSDGSMIKHRYQPEPLQLRNGQDRVSSTIESSGQGIYRTWTSCQVESHMQQSKPSNKDIVKKRRNLPKDAVKTLKTWINDNIFHAYPNENEKHELSEQTGLTNLQVNNWFINARRRVWPQMLKERGLDPDKYIKPRRRKKPGNGGISKRYENAAKRIKKIYIKQTENKDFIEHPDRVSDSSNSVPTNESENIEPSYTTSSINPEECLNVGSEVAITSSEPPEEDKFKALIILVDVAVAVSRRQERE